MGELEMKERQMTVILQEQQQPSKDDVQQQHLQL